MLIQEPESTPEAILGMDTFEQDGSTVIEIVEENVSGDIKWVSCIDDGEPPDLYPKQAIVELLANSEDAHKLADKQSSQSIEPQTILRPTGDSPGRGESKDYSIEVIDNGIGVSANEFKDAFFEDPIRGGVNKKEDPDLIGEFGKGSLAAMSLSKNDCKFVASSHLSEERTWNWSVTRFNEEESEYEYLTVDGSVPTYEGVFEVNAEVYTHGTITKIFNVDSTKIPSTATGESFTRRLGYKFPNPSVPITITDDRQVYTSKPDEIDYTGLFGQMKQSNTFDSEFTKTVSVAELGDVKMTVCVAKEDAEISKKFLTTQDHSRVFFMLNGVTHHTMSDSILESKFGLSNISDEAFIFIECSNLEFKFSDIFKTNRTEILKDKTQATKLCESVQEAVRNWSEVQEVNSNRFTVDGRDNQPNISTLQIQGKSSVCPEFTASSGESIEVVAEADAPVKYLEQEYVSVDVQNMEGDVDYTISGNTVTFDITPQFDQMESEYNAVVIVYDLNENRHVEKTFTISKDTDSSQGESTERNTKAEQFAKRASETGLDTMIGIQKYIYWDDIEQEVSELEELFERLERFSVESEQSLVDQLSSELLVVEEKEQFVQTLFELLGYSSDADSYEFKERTWKLSEVVAQLEDDSEETATAVAQDLVDIGFKKLCELKQELTAWGFCFVSMKVGMESHSRKNRQGKLFEDAVEQVLNQLVEESEYNLMVKDQRTHNFKLDGTEKQFDFALVDTDGNIVSVIEANCYASKGSKQIEMSRSSQNQKQNCSIEDITFNRVTDGSGLSQEEYRKAYKSVEGNLYNLHLLAEADIEDLL